MRTAIRVRHVSRRTEDAYVYWAKWFVEFHNTRHPAEMRETEIAAFLSHLAVMPVIPTTQPPVPDVP